MGDMAKTLYEQYVQSKQEHNMFGDKEWDRLTPEERSIWAATAQKFIHLIHS